MELYSWWKHGRKEENDRSNELFDKIASETKPYEMIKQTNGNFELISHHREHPSYKTWIESYDALEEKDDEMLMRLIKIRHVLWT
jgi:hypothetical protein